MKKLYLLRHAETEDEAESGKDIDRKLNENGHKETIELNTSIINKNLSCDIALCSIALRARQTYSHIMASITSKTPVEYLEDLYYVDLDVMLKCLKNLDDDHKSAFIVSHNPTIGELASYLTGDKIRFKTCTLKLLEIDINLWSELSPTCAKLIWSIPDSNKTSK